MLRTMRTILIVMLNMIFIGLVVFSCIQMIHLGYGFAYDTLSNSSVAPPPGEDKVISIQSGQTEYDVADDLAGKDLVKGKWSFLIRMKLERDKRGSLKNGEFVLKTSMSYDEILNEIYGG